MTQYIEGMQCDRNVALFFCYIDVEIKLPMMGKGDKIKYLNENKEDIDPVNSKKYKNVLYEMRYITDLKDMLNSSAELFAHKTAYLVKDVPGGEYKPITYPQTKADVDAFGTRMIDLGLKGKKIAIIGENSYKWVVSYLGVVNGTGVVVPLDRELPPQELANLINRADVSVIVYSKKLEKSVKEILEKTESVKYTIGMGKERHEGRDLSFDRIIDEGRNLISQGDMSFINAVIDPEAMCSILFTSGTMGLAKGVMLSHKNISANVYNMSKYVKLGDDWVGLSVLPMHHTYELTCHIFTSMYQGIAVAICEGLKYIQKNMKECHATVMLGVPLVFESMHKKIMKQAKASGSLGKMKKMMSVSRMLKLYNNQNRIRKIFSPLHGSIGNSMSLFISGGAAINPQVIKDFESLGIPMMQGYGMTENAPIIAVNRDCYSKAEAAGFPMPGTEIRIINKDILTGIGEIICKGPSVMLGYYKDPEETAKVLQDGWLRTGDYGYMDDEGLLYVCGRKKNVIVTKNGKNIFPEEVEYYLQASPYILEALVHGIDDEKSDDLVIKAEIYPDFEAIKSHLGELSENGWNDLFKKIVDDVNDNMPSYKRIKRYHIRETEFDKTTTRKIKRHNQANFDNDK